MPVGEEKPSTAYLLSEIGGQEVERLRKQAALSLSMELPGILETLPKAGSFVDLGCGVGLLADAVAQACPDAQVHGFDADELAISQSRRNFGGRPGLSFECRRLEMGPPPGFPLADVAVMRFVLMHLPDPRRALEAARAWLKPGGVLHILEGDDRSMTFTPALDWLPHLFDLMQEVQKLRGGDRRLGRELPGLLDSPQWSILGDRQFSLDPLVTAAAVPKVFLPVAEYYLTEAKRGAVAPPETIKALEEGFEQIRGGALTRATIPIFHVWAQNVPEPAQ